MCIELDEKHKVLIWSSSNKDKQLLASCKLPNGFNIKPIHITLKINWKFVQIYHLKITQWLEAFNRLGV